MVFQAIGITASIIWILGFLLWLGRLTYRQASAPKGYVVILTAVSLLCFLTFAAVVALLILRKAV